MRGWGPAPRNGGPHGRAVSEAFRAQYILSISILARMAAHDEGLCVVVEEWGRSCSPPTLLSCRGNAGYPAAPLRVDCEYPARPQLQPQNRVALSDNREGLALLRRVIGATRNPVPGKRQQQQSVLLRPLLRLRQSAFGCFLLLFFPWAAQGQTSPATVTTLAGGATSGRADGLGTAATFYNPFGIAMDAAGTTAIVVRGRGEAELRGG